MKENVNRNKLKIIIIIGKDLTQKTIEYMVKHRMREYGENKKDFENNEKDSIFFFLKDGTIIKAFGMLKPVTLYCDAKQYEIMGIGNIMAVEKSKGYGTILMKHIIDYLDNNGYVGMGGTDNPNFTFYEKCGFIFITKLLERFVYVDENTKEHRPEAGDDKMFIFDKNNKLQELIKSNGDIIIKVPLW